MHDENVLSPGQDRDDEAWLPLDTARDCFAWLVAGPHPVSVDGRRFPGLPRRLIPLDELRDLLLDTQCSGHTRDAVWRHLVQRARAVGGTWTLACVGLALPTLARSAGRLAPHYRGDRADLHAAVLAGFIQALAQVELSRPAISQQLRWAAFQAGYAALSESLDAPVPAEAADLEAAVDAAPPTGPVFRSASPRRPWGHPDLVLARAIADGILTATEAELIGTTRLDDTSLSDWAEQHGVSYRRANLARWRAEQRLVAYLRDQAQDTDPEDPIESHVLTSLALRAAPPSAATSPRRSPTVSGRGRNGRPIGPKKLSRAVKENAPKSGLLGCGEDPPSAGSSEVPECA
jgi:hypothetical protein